MAERTMTPIQMNALRTLYGVVLQLVRAADDEPIAEGTRRVVIEKNFVAVCAALDNVKSVMRKGN